MKKLKKINQFLKEIPKTDLHLHLDGSLKIETLIDLSKAGHYKLPSYSRSGLKKLVFKENYSSLEEYLKGFIYTCNVLRDKENLERVAYELAVENQKEGVRYIEVRFAPQLNMTKNLSIEDVLISVDKGLKRAKQEFNLKILDKDEPEFDYGIITCAMRMFNQYFSPYYSDLFNIHKYSSDKDIIKLGALELAKAVISIRDRYGIPIVGFDLAGQENGFPAEDFSQAYDYVHSNFLHKTVHAGEAYGAESIFQAITKCSADRLGHSLYLFDQSKIHNIKKENKKKYINNLVNFIGEKRITIEVCLSSNRQTNPEMQDLKKHPFKKMLKNKLSLSLCTDNRLISNTNICNEYKLAIEHFNLSQQVLKNIVLYGFKRSFLGTYQIKRTYVRKAINYYDKILKKYED